MVKWPVQVFPVVMSALADENSGDPSFAANAEFVLALFDRLVAQIEAAAGVPVQGLRQSRMEVQAVWDSASAATDVTML